MMHGARTLQSPSGQTLASGATFLVGHRGARAFAPENTLPAFEKARRLGCRMVELDVHLSRDGELMVHHDDRLARCTDIATRYPHRDSDFISDFTAAELQVLDAGSWYVRELTLPADHRQTFLRSLTEAEIAYFVSADDRTRYASGTVRIPTLDEVLDLARQQDLMVNIEIKSIPRLYEGIAERVVERVHAAGMRGSVLVSSFDHEQLVEIRRLDPSLATGILTSDRLSKVVDYLHLLDADAYHPGCYDDFDSLGFGSVRGKPDLRSVAAVLTSGHLVFAWTCNESVRMKTLAAAGLTGIITDYPNRFVTGEPVRDGD